MEWFTNSENLETLKGEYLTYLRKFKADEELMKEIDAQFKELCEKFGAEYNLKIEEENKGKSVEYQKAKYDASSDKFAETLKKIIDFNMNIEIIGQWIWCFDSKEYHEQLKELGFWFSASKKAWVFSGSKKKFIRSRNTINDIRSKWGSEVVKEKDDN